MALAAAALLALLALPLAPSPAPPFPKILTDAATITDVAPGVQYGEYRMRTPDGPLAVHLIAVDVNNPSVRIGTTLAQNRLVSSGETTSSMGARTGAVAGVNGDYFDINQTNQPLNILIGNAHLIRMPMQRWAIAFGKDNTVTFGEYKIAETATLPNQTFALNTMNDWPPPGDQAVFMTPEYGPLRPFPSVTEVQLEPVDTDPPFGRYRVTGIADNTQTQPPGYYLAIGSNAYSSQGVPNTGDPVDISATSSPSIFGLNSAIGGGPLLVKNGTWYPDPDGPSKGEFATHMPATSVGVTREGKVLLFQIDGRQPERSIGVLQPQLASLMIAFGVVTGMQFDGGGSSTMIARLPGQDAPAVQNTPSDGRERRVADALMVYSDAPIGKPARLYAFPQAIRAMPAARIPVHFAVTDAGVHAVDCDCLPHATISPADAGTLSNGIFTAGPHPVNARMYVTAGTLHAQVPIYVTAAPAFVEITPRQPALLSGQSIALQAHAYDEHGYPIALPEHLFWHAASGSIDSSGQFTAGARDSLVDVRLGSVLAQTVVTVGEHSMPIAFLRAATFSTAPHGGKGSVEKNSPCEGCVTLSYDFTGTGRAAYANADIPLAQRALALSADVFGDGNGEILRLAVNNAINERFLYTVAKVDWHGWKHVEYRFSPALPQPITLKSLYVINRVGPGEAAQAAGSVTFRDVRVILAGSAQTSPK